MTNIPISTASSNIVICKFCYSLYIDLFVTHVVQESLLERRRNIIGAFISVAARSKRLLTVNCMKYLRYNLLRHSRIGLAHLCIDLICK